MIIISNRNLRPSLGDGDIGYSLADKKRILYLGKLGVEPIPIGYVENDPNNLRALLTLSTSGLMNILNNISLFEADPIWLSDKPNYPTKTDYTNHFLLMGG